MWRRVAFLSSINQSNLPQIAQVLDRLARRFPTSSCGFHPAGCLAADQQNGTGRGREHPWETCRLKEDSRGRLPLSVKVVPVPRSDSLLSAEEFRPPQPHFCCPSAISLQPTLGY